MKFYILLLIPLFFIIVPKGVDAQGGVWIENKGTCSGSLYSPSDMRHLIKSDDISGIVNSLSGKNSCFNRSDYQISEFYDSGILRPEASVSYCLPGTAVARDSDGSGYNTSYCCTDAHPYWDRGAGYCCPQELMDFDTGFCNATTGPSGTIISYGLEQAKFRGIDSIEDLHEPIQPGTTSYVCAASGCLVKGPTLLDRNFTLTNPLNILDGYTCLGLGSDLSMLAYENGTAIENGAVCVAQKAQLPAIATAIAQAPGIISCTDLLGGEQERCLQCLQRNFEASNNDEPQSFVYSSIGCVDTRRDPFITRLFQLGFGLLSGFAVVRLMMAAIKMQSADVAKHQEGREMATSAIVALVTLAAAIPILRYIGINLLSLLPFGFLN